VDPFACAIFLLAALTLAGVAQTAWFASPASRAFALPLDGGLRLRGRRLFGENKTTRGFIVMVPASAAAFTLLAVVAGDPAVAELWVLPPSGYALLGAWAAIGFMAGELPNSFVKRQLDIPPGEAPRSRTWTAVQFIGDRLDSGIGMLAAVSVAVPTPALTWIYVLLIGPAIHWSFSLVLFHLGLKRRAA
jgi:CDP-2,3-bis-(O-geranylgeranyl)-sn-glycerol synthase